MSAGTRSSSPATTGRREPSTGSARASLPAALSGQNELFRRAKPHNRPVTLLAVGGGAVRVAGHNATCTVVARLDNGVGASNEEQGQPVAVCRDAREPWQAFCRSSSTWAEPTGTHLKVRLVALHSAQLDAQSGDAAWNKAPARRPECAAAGRAVAAEPGRRADPGHGATGVFRLPCDRGMIRGAEFGSCCGGK